MWHPLPAFVKLRFSCSGMAVAGAHGSTCAMWQACQLGRPEIGVGSSAVDWQGIRKGKNRQQQKSAITGQTTAVVGEREAGTRNQTHSLAGGCASYSIFSVSLPRPEHSRHWPTHV